MKLAYILDNGMVIEKGLCTCLVTRIHVKLAGIHFQNTLDNDEILITHGKVFNLIEKYGIKRTEEEYILIETKELFYFIDKPK